MRALARVTLLAALISTACGPTVDLTSGLQVEVNDTGWFDAGIVQGQNKLVPAARVTIKNVSDQTLVQLQLNAQFRRVTDPEEWGYAFMTAAGSKGLAPGATAGPFLLKSEHGYTGSDESRQDMLKNSQFVDAKVQLFAKYGSVQWVRKGEHPIRRQLIEK
jgi:hypothetical protein